MNEFDAALEHFNEVFIAPYKFRQDVKNMMINSFTFGFKLRDKLNEKQEKNLDHALNKV